MRSFESTVEVYETLGAFIGQVAASDGFGPRILEIGFGLQFELDEPDAAVLVRPEGDELRTLLGEVDESAEARLALPASTLHRIFLNQDSYSAAMSRGELVVSDEVREFVPLIAPLGFAASPRYAELLETQGKEDLL